jgi:hypothetical protein
MLQIDGNMSFEELMDLAEGHVFGAQKLTEWEWHLVLRLAHRKALTERPKATLIEDHKVISISYWKLRHRQR